MRQIAWIPAILLASTLPSARAGVGFTGIAAGDATDTAAIVWTRLDDATPAHAGVTAPLSLQLSTDNTTFKTVIPAATTGEDHDYTYKTELTNLTPATQYFYRFTSGSVTSPTGTFKTAPAPATAAPLRIAFSGDAHGSWRPYGMTKNLAAAKLDAFIFLGDTMYETASAGKNPSAPAPLSTTPAATPEKILAEYHRKYREQFLPVATSPTPSNFASLSTLYQSQGVYALLDNHELGNKQYQCGGAPLAGPIDNIPGTDAGIDAKNTQFDVAGNSDFINKTAVFQAMVQAYTDYLPIRDQRTTPDLWLSAPFDMRAHHTLQQYSSRRWGKNAILINLDDRSYRDSRPLTAAGADDSGPRADNPSRTMLGLTQFVWFQKELLAAQAAGIRWKIIAISSPIDQTSPIAQTSAPSTLNVPKDPAAPSLDAIKDSGKGWMGGYRAERNALLKFIADNHITNVVFLSTDDHYNRVNELNYSPAGKTADQATYQRVPTAFEIVAGPIGADGAGVRPNDHAYPHIAAEAQDIARAQIAAGVDPLGLDPSFPGLHNVSRENDPNLATGIVPLAKISSVDFYSPDTFNYAQLDISADGVELTITTFGIDSYAADTFPDPATLPDVRPILSFSITAQ